MIAVCKWCGSDEYAELDKTTGVALCIGPGHPTERMWEPKREIASTVKRLADGIAAELGLYYDLLTCLREGEWAETGVVEHRYGTTHPVEYKWMVDRWGHVAQDPRRYSVTSFIGSTLGALSRATNVAFREGRGTGFFDYNQSVGFWTLEPCRTRRSSGRGPRSRRNSDTSRATGRSLDIGRPGSSRTCRTDGEAPMRW